MKHQNVFWGVILIILGFLFIFDNLDVIDLQWRALWRLWPVLLILWGISILPVKGFIKVLLSLVTALLAMLIFFNTQTGYGGYSNWSLSNKPNDTDEQHYAEAFDEQIETAEVNFDVVAGEFRLSGSTDDLIELKRKGNTGNYRFLVQNSEDHADIIISHDNNIRLSGKIKNQVTLKLNPEPLWDLNLDVGAADLDMDLTPFKVRNITLDAGATQISLKLGDKSDKTEVNIDTGASDIDIWVPVTSGCLINTDAFLSNKEFDGFNKTDQGTYVTENFESARHQIFIDYDGAVSDFKVKRY